MIKNQVNNLVDLVDSWKKSVNPPEHFLIWVENEVNPIEMALPDTGQKWKRLSEMILSIEETNTIQKIHALTKEKTLITSHDIEYLKDKEAEEEKQRHTRVPGKYENVEVRREVTEVEVLLEKQMEFFRLVTDSWERQSTSQLKTSEVLIDKLLELFAQQSDRVSVLETTQSNNVSVLAQNILDNAKTQAALVAAASNEDSPLASLLPTLLPGLVGRLGGDESSAQAVAAPAAQTPPPPEANQFLTLFQSLPPAAQQKGIDFFFNLLTENGVQEP